MTHLTSCHIRSSALVLAITVLLTGCTHQSSNMANRSEQSTSVQDSGYATPEALVEHLNSLIDATEPIKDKLRAVHAVSLAESPEARQGFQQQIEFLGAFQNLMQAATSAFGDASSPMLGMMKSQIDNSISTMHVESLKMISKTTAEVDVDQPMGTPITQYLIKTDRGWLINEDENYARTPELKQALRMLPLMTKAFNHVADQIQAGIITNPMGIDMAIGQAMRNSG